MFGFLRGKKMIPTGKLKNALKLEAHGYLHDEKMWYVCSLSAPAMWRDSAEACNSKPAKREIQQRNETWGSWVPKRLGFLNKFGFTLGHL